MSRMEPSEISAVLERRRRQYDECGASDALAAPVNTERFYRFVASINELTVGEYGDTVEVTFEEPVPGATNLDSEYRYTVAVGREEVEGHTRCEMPKAELLTLQQVAITIWALATGEIY